MLRDEMDLYTKLSGEDATHVPIMKIGAYLDGYEKGLSVLEDIKAEICEMRSKQNCSCSDCIDIIDRYISGKDDNG